MAKRDPFAHIPRRIPLPRSDPAVFFEVDYSDITRIQQVAAKAIGQMEWITAMAMTRSAKAARLKVGQEIFPKIQGGPTTWTRRGLISTSATPKRLKSAVGFNYGGGALSEFGAKEPPRGVPSGRYIETLTRGGDRAAKSTERRIWRAGALPQGSFLVINTRNPGIRLTAQGNLPAGEWQRITSRIRGGTQAGSNFDAPIGAGSRGRSGAKRRERDYFVLRRDELGPTRWQLGSEPSAIAVRTGKGPKGGTGKGSGRPGRPQTIGYKRGFKTVLNVTDQPNYERKFNIQSIALKEYNRVFSVEWRKQLEVELLRRR
jgi:hypothetical protein